MGFVKVVLFFAITGTIGAIITAMGIVGPAIGLAQVLSAMGGLGLVRHDVVMAIGAVVFSTIGRFILKVAQIAAYRQKSNKK